MREKSGRTSLIIVHQRRVKSNLNSASILRKNPSCDNSPLQNSPFFLSHNSGIILAAKQSIVGSVLNSANGSFVADAVKPIPQQLNFSSQKCKISKFTSTTLIINALFNLLHASQLYYILQMQMLSVKLSK